VSRCKSCGAEIIWAVTTNGRRIPLDAEPEVDAPGLFRIEIGGPPPGAFAVRKLYTSHFATCPNADQHRKPR
jgi:hypothetical protein